MIRLILIIGTGSFIGGISRFLTSRLIQNYADSTFPYGTFVINIVGCFLAGLFYGLSERTNNLNSEWIMFLTIGFCGGFTTFSAFSNENMALLRQSEFLYFALYAGLSVFLGLLATFIGNLITKLL
jgi:CrcB protein